MVYIPKDSIESAENRSAEFAARFGCGISPSDVTTHWYSSEFRKQNPDGSYNLPDNVDFAIIIPDSDPKDLNNRLSQLVIENAMDEGEINYVVAAYNEWAVGVGYAVGDIVSHNDRAYSCRQAHASQVDWPPASAFTLWVVHRMNEPELPWVACEPVEIGWTRTYNDVVYECIQAHTTQPDWTPPAVPALWASQAPPTGEWAVGVAYTIGDLVTYDGDTYECRQSHTSQAGWTPPVVPALWLLVS